MTRPAPADPAPRRPRRRVTAAELFERVVPEDPPTMPFGRAKRSDTDITIRRSAPPSEDETLPLGEDPTVRLGDDDTVRLGEDDTVRLGEDDTRPLDR